MFSIDFFLEIQIVGILLLIAITPILTLLSAESRDKKGFCPPLENIPDKSAKAVLLLVMAFTLGIAGNRLIDDLIGSRFIQREGQEGFDRAFKSWAQKDATKRQSLKLAEFEVSKDAVLAKWLERHKSFMRVLRGAAFSCLLFLMSVAAYEIARHYKKLNLRARYSASYYVLIAVLFILFSFAYYRESTHYYERICEVYTNIPKCEINEEAQALANQK